MGAGLISLADLPAAIERLDESARERATRLYDVRVVTARTDPPAELVPWLVDTFGSEAAVREQTVVRVTNRATLESTLYAPLRAHRPVDGPGAGRELAEEITATEGDPFCDPLTGTPANAFGRVRGARMISGANAAAADAHHAVIVFESHDPLAFDPDLVADLLTTGRAWADAARASDPAATHYLLIWNCLWRAGGSIVHGHAQALLGTGAHYARLERLRRDADAYRSAHNGELLDDMVDIHRDLGLTTGGRDGVTVIAHLTPVKEREAMVIGPVGMDERDPAFAERVAETLMAFRDRVGVRSFNLALWRPPLDGPPEWRWLRPMARIVDRGDLASRPSDIGAMELFATPIVGTDPYELIAALR
ncbi:MAG TPA: hypothetical protein VFW95_03350 [Candidatus Limnocylindria bacterium]|nr:hypothetical protein [Candidatus Limnocylindria bacterium]